MFEATNSNTDMKAWGYYSLVKTGECGLTKRLAFSLSPGTGRCSGGVCKGVVYQLRICSFGRQINWDKTLEGEIRTCSRQQWENIDPAYKFPIPYSTFVKIQCFNYSCYHHEVFVTPPPASFGCRVENKVSEGRALLGVKCAHFQLNKCEMASVASQLESGSFFSNCFNEALFSISSALMPTVGSM